MGILSRLFGKPEQTGRRQTITSQQDVQAGGKANPYVIERPARIGELRQACAEQLGEARSQGIEIPELNAEQLDQMIAEEIKMAFLRDCFGTSGKEWECGERAYLPQSIQTQLIHFKDGRPSVIFYTDFSQFGGFTSEKETKTRPEPILIDSDTADIQWTLCRGRQRLVGDGSLLSTLFMVAHQKGWHAPDLFSMRSGKTLCILRPMIDVYKEDALELARILKSIIGTTASVEDRRSAAIMQEYIDFFAGGGFHIEKA
ncbi:hypothetical protein [Undibacterium sp.]|uniref:hypothetical protein n=1 Tax=Undibacterium sp. TaxID=1914977 RepID=UPI002B59DD01|nr:hypothetical protein [Undibacterium sp.]HTD03464.1 hypothetical protein [Undibacterium sp.]